MYRIVVIRFLGVVCALHVNQQAAPEATRTRGISSSVP